MPKRIFVGIPILNRLDLLERCLHHIDYPADILIVNNNSVDKEFNTRIMKLAERRGLDLRNQSRDLGVAGSWNFITAEGIRRGHQLIFIGSNDTLLHPGSLESVLKIEKKPADVIWHINAWNFFAIHSQAIELVGWFDENFYPAYKEDQDYSYRCDVLAKVKRISRAVGGAEHLGSQTIRSDPDYTVHNGTTSSWNARIYREKWGGDAGEERYFSPYRRPDKDWRWWPNPGDSIPFRDWDNCRRS